MGKVIKAMQRKQYLEVDVRAVDSSVQIMNHFNGLLGTHISYGTLFLNNALLMRIFGHRYSISLFIAKSKPEDYPVPEQATTASTTFSELRLLTKELREFSTTDPMQVSSRSVYHHPVLRTIQYHSQQGAVDTSRKLALKVPLVFRAQNMLNLRGYGDEWSWGYRIKEGTRYGETNIYYVTHLEVHPC